jgi:transposase
MLRHRLTDEQWDLIADVIPNPNGRVGPPRDRRQVVDGILRIMRTGSPWRDLPEAFGPWATVWDLFDKWNDDGTLQAIFDRLRIQVKIDKTL